MTGVVTGRDGSRPVVAVVGAGGTIAMEGAHPFDWVDYGDTGIVNPIGTVLDRLGTLLPDVEVVPVPFRTIGSTAIGLSDWRELLAVVADLCKTRPDLAGIVVTHGTATLEETAWFLDLTLDIAPTVVLVGAQRPPNTSGSDAGANLRAAMALAAAPQARDCGVLVVMDGHVFAARDVSKVTNFELSAFQALEFGPLGRVEADGQVTLRRRPVRSAARQRFDVSGLDALPRVDVTMSYAGADGTAIDAFRAAGAQGIVSAGLPPGRCTPAERQALIQAVRSGVVVVQSSRAAWGTVPVQAYNVACGILTAGDLQPNKARIALSLALTVTKDPQGIQDILLGV